MEQIEYKTLKAFDLVRTTEKASLFKTEKGLCWIPMSCVKSIDIFIGKKRPVRVVYKSSFSIAYVEDESRRFLDLLNFVKAVTFEEN